MGYPGCENEPFLRGLRCTTVSLSVMDFTPCVSQWVYLPPIEKLSDVYCHLVHKRMLPSRHFASRVTKPLETHAYARRLNSLDNNLSCGSPEPRWVQLRR